MVSRHLERGFGCEVGSVDDRSGDVVLVAADALVVDRVLEGALIVVERADPDLAGLYFRAARLDPRRLCVLGAWQYSVKIRVVVKTKLVQSLSVAFCKHE